MEDPVKVTAQIDGATIVKELTYVLSRVVDKFSLLQKQSLLQDVFAL
jgi:hypothetical protein